MNNHDFFNFLNGWREMTKISNQGFIPCFGEYPLPLIRQQNKLVNKMYSLRDEVSETIESYCKYEEELRLFINQQYAEQALQNKGGE